MKSFIKLLIFLTFTLNANAELSHVNPSNWWVNMKETKLQVIIHGDNISDTKPELNYPGVTLLQSIHVENPNYLFLYLDIAPETKAGSFDINFTKNGEVVESFEYKLKNRLHENGKGFIGFDHSDTIYLIQPDRYSNGSHKNDSIDGMNEVGVDRAEPYARHGGDLRGIIDHLDYIQDMGFTALWLTPVTENNQDLMSYHGYACTDFYKVDPRYGTLDEYIELSQKAAQKGIKLILDAVPNHSGSENWFVKDLPMHNWTNLTDEKTITNHRRTTNMDPHAAPSDADIETKGWFSPMMPDMNVRNNLVADYFIQNIVWWIETLDLGGIRVDTYPYPGKEFLADFCNRIESEYPNMNMVAEEWTGNPVIVSYWQRDKFNKDGYRGNMPSLFDFPNQIALPQAFISEEGFDSGLVTLYEMLSNDNIYSHPEDLVVFLGNHDTPRYLVELNNNVNLAKNAIAWLFTVRGIPQFYYGDEVLMSHPKNGGHGVIRSDFPGGFDGDKKNAFTGKGLTTEEADFQKFVKKLLHWRAKTPPVQTGEMIHFVPVDGVYVYFRFNSESTVMVVINKNVDEYSLKLDRFERYIGESTKAWDVIHNKSISLNESLMLSPETPMILELK
jgi:glycosidase